MRTEPYNPATVWAIRIATLLAVFTTITLLLP